MPPQLYALTSQSQNFVKQTSKPQLKCKTVGFIHSISLAYLELSDKSLGCRSSSENPSSTSGKFFGLDFS